MNAPQAQTTTSLAAVKQQGSAVALQSDLKIDMFSLRGFELAQRIAKAFATSDAVPTQFRLMVFKKDRDGGQWIENPAAMGNCLVAIETARAVGMSITAVMQHANIIEGKLSWSAQFWIAAINVSGRFLPLRFDMKSRGTIKAKYREKLGWNKQKGGYDFEDRVVEVEDHVCIAWTLPAGFKIPSGIYTLDQARAAGLPVIESSPVSMKLAVEEGWYSKSGSKWQTEMRFQMLQYRCGAFFGRIHAPDIVMGMGRTTEELADMANTIDVAEDGTVTPVPVAELRPRATGPTPMADVVVDRTDGGSFEPEAGGAGHQESSAYRPAFDVQAYIARVQSCGDIETLEVLANEAEALPNGPERDAAMQALVKRDGELQEASIAAHNRTASGISDQGGDPREAYEQQAQQQRTAAAPASRRAGRATQTTIE